MILTEEQMRGLRLKELDLLRAFVGCCEEMGLRYFVVQGTLLGAVRHGGFIPWDDDIDVGLFREDFDRFVHDGQKHLPSSFFVQTCISDPEFPQGFAKVRDSNTTFVETTSRTLKINHGIYIDVFPFDHYPDGVLRGALYDVKKLLLRYRIRCSLDDPADKTFSIANCLRRTLKALSKVVYPSISEARIKQYELFGKVKTGEYLVNNGSPWGRRERIPACWFQDFTSLEFEGMRVNAPSRYREYLEHVYGDYMTLPPLEERGPHHYICAFDLDKGS